MGLQIMTPTKPRLCFKTIVIWVGKELKNNTFVNV